MASEKQKGNGTNRDEPLLRDLLLRWTPEHCKPRYDGIFIFTSLPKLNDSDENFDFIDGKKITYLIYSKLFVGVFYLKFIIPIANIFVTIIIKMLPSKIVLSQGS